MTKSTLILLVLLVGLVGVYQFVLKDKPVNLTNAPASNMPTPEPETALVGADKDSIAKVIWQFSANEYGELEQFEPGQWRFVRPATVQVDAAKADEYITTVTSLSGTPKIPLTDNFKLEDVGLAQGYGTVVVERRDGNKEVIRVGGNVPGDSQAYVHKEGTDFVTLVYSYMLTELKKMPTDLEPSASASPGSSPS